MKSKAVTPFWADKALYVTVLSLLLPILDAKLGIQLDAVKVAGLLSVAVAFVVGHKWKSGAILLRELELEALQLAQQKLGPDVPQTPSASLAVGFVNSGAVKPLVVALVAGAALFATPAHAQLQVAAGPTLPLTEVRPGQHPVQLAPGAGAQLSFTLPEFQRAIAGRAWDLLDVNLMGFGTVLTGASGQQVGALSVAVGICTLSSLLCLGGGHDVVTAPGTKSDFFAVFALSINFAGQPTSPPAGTASGTAGMLRGNTLYFGAL